MPTKQQSGRKKKILPIMGKRHPMKHFIDNIPLTEFFNEKPRPCVCCGILVRAPGWHISTLTGGVTCELCYVNP
jgi:hypothetical protein